ncbi:MAG: CYTH domain-containing protein [Halomonadaceae bacterium]|nr:MAG: CYTH domain-containing protein [Halomonadaceae bacterium]
MAREIEIKLSLSPDQVPRLKAALLVLPGAREGATIAMRNTYYDTPAGDLNRRMMALRLRDAGGTPLQTLKTRGALSGGVATRGEWEWPLTEYRLNMELLVETPLGESPLLPQLAPCFDTHFERQIIDLMPGDGSAALIEVALDHGEVLAKGESKPLCEMELELKDGEPAVLQQLALQLSQQVPLFLNTISKAEQGYYLAGLYHPRISDSVSDDPVDTWLHGLSVHWLRDKQDGWEEALALHHQLQDCASAAGEASLWQSVMDELLQHRDAGTSPRQALQSIAALAPLQLALALH